MWKATKTRATYTFPSTKSAGTVSLEVTERRAEFLHLRPQHKAAAAACSSLW
jgi:hypothetical protein